jgi:hypothetical protein
MAQSAGNPTASAEPTTASGKMQDQSTAQQVIEMFRALNNLLVTDDAAAIEVRRRSRTPGGCESKPTQRIPVSK